MCKTATFKKSLSTYDFISRPIIALCRSKVLQNVPKFYTGFMYINTRKQALRNAKKYEHNRLSETSVVDRHRCHMAAKFGVFVDEGHSKLLTLYWLPKLHKRPYKSRFIAYSSSCTTTDLSILLTYCITAIKIYFIKYYTVVYERNGKELLWSIKNSGEILNKLKSRGSSLSTHDFSTLYTTLSHYLVKEKLTD